MSAVGMIGVRPTWSSIIMWALDINGVVVAVANLGNVSIFRLLGSQLPVTLYFAIAIVDLSLDFSCCGGVPVALGGKDVTGTNMLIEDVLTLLLFIENYRNKQTNK